MPSTDVSDLREVVDAINKLCDTMKTSTYEAIEDETEPIVETEESFEAEYAPQYVECSEVELVSPEQVCVRHVETYWSDSASQVSPPGRAEPVSEMYYTASSEVSLLSDTDPADKALFEDESDVNSEDVKECPIAGHVAAMRERFESMTRTNTPCPDLLRSTSPSHDVFTNITSSPDFLG